MVASAQDEVRRGIGEEGVGQDSHQSVQELDGSVFKEHDGHEPYVDNGLVPISLRPLISCTMARVMACSHRSVMGCTRINVTGSRGKMPSILGTRPLVRENLTNRGCWLAMEMVVCLKERGRLR